MIPFVVDPELEGMMPEGSETENRLLEAELIAAGRTEQPLLVWRGKGLLVDGHRRWRVIRQHNLQYEVVEQEFESRAAVMQWILTHQLARRSISDHERAMYTAQLHALIKARKVHGDGEGETAEIVAEMTGQSRRSVFRKLKYAKAVDQIAPGWQAEVRRGRIAQAVVHRLAKLPKEKQHELLDGFYEQDGGDSGRIKFLKSEVKVKDQPPAKSLKGIEMPEITDVDLPTLDVDTKARKRQVGDRTIVADIDDAFTALQSLKDQCQKLIARNTLDSPELRNRVFGAIQTIHTNLKWVRDRRSGDAAG